MTRKERLDDALSKWDFYEIAKITLEEEENEN
jgi:hypothetical protein